MPVSWMLLFEDVCVTQKKCAVISKIAITMKFILFYPGFFLFSIFLITCQKEPIEEQLPLPSPTFTGSNTLACIINGVVFVSEGKAEGTSESDLQGIRFSCHTQVHSCYISAYEVEQYNMVLNFNFDLEKLGERQYFGWADGRVWEYDETGEATLFVTRNDSTGWVMIDTVDKHTLVGTFQYIANSTYPNQSQGKIITVGWFDISID